MKILETKFVKINQPSQKSVTHYENLFSFSLLKETCEPTGGENGEKKYDIDSVEIAKICLRNQADFWENIGSISMRGGRQACL